jgi:hypothetical protein
MQVGDRVERIKGGPGYLGMTGTVIDFTEGRVRIRWDTKPGHQGDGKEHSGKRTWIDFRALKVLPPLTDQFHCRVCGMDLGWDRPSGVCSEKCLRLAQSFTAKGGSTNE